MWKLQESTVLSELYDVVFADDKTGWVVGRHGVILKTIDGGNVWVRQESNVETALFGVSFVDSNTGWAVGEINTILHTDNGGETWVKQDEENDRILNQVVFVDSNTGWAVGEYGTIIHTSDGGKQWFPQVNPKGTDILYGACFTDANYGVAVGIGGYTIATEDGGATWTILDSAVDAGRDNNRGLAVLTVEGPPRVLWVGQGKSTIPEALELQGMYTDRVLPGDLPDSFSALSAWDAVILDNVSSRDLSLKTLDLLESWVRTRGGGLMMIGGNASFGLGAYQGTPVERSLPVDMDSPSSLYIPSLSMVMVIDKSGSMDGEVGDGKTKLDVVKDAVMGAVEVLNPLYTIGLAAFDADVEWTIPLTEAGNEDKIR